MEKLLLDTDIGSDIDDALCLAYLLAQPRCQLLGITTVGGQPAARAAIASALCQAAGVRLPIYPGAASSLLVAQRQPSPHQAPLFDHLPQDRTFPTGQAIEFLRQTIRAHPGEITLLTIGPLTNIGLLFAVDPELPGLLRRLVLMAGWFRQRPPQADLGDWNLLCDPHAAAVVYRAPVAQHRSVPFDVSQQVALPPDELERRFRTGLLRLLWQCAEPEFRQSPLVYFHDPLAATTIFDDSICGFQTGTVQVNLVSEATMGMTHWQPDGHQHQVALSITPSHFFDHFFSVFAT